MGSTALGLRQGSSLDSEPTPTPMGSATPIGIGVFELSV